MLIYLTLTSQVSLLSSPSSVGKFSNSIDNLAINDLPERCSRLMPARIYLVISELFDYTRAVVRHINTSVRPVVFVCQSQPQKFYQSDIDKAGAFERLISQGRVRIFQTKSLQNENMSTKQRYAAIVRLINEVKYFVKAKNALLVIENGSQVLGVDNEKLAAKAIQTWQNHCVQYGNSVLMLLSGIQSNPLILNNIRMMQDKIAGLSSVNLHDGIGRLTVQHWYSTSGVCADQQFQLQFDENGGLTASQIEQVQSQQMNVAAVDSESVWALRVVVQGEEWPQAWAVSDKFADLDKGSDSAVSGTIILPYGRNTEIEVLARQVFMLRKTRGNQLKIIVREVSARMRHSQERLIRYLGASMVVPLEVSFSRLLGIIDSIGDLEFESQLCDDFDQAFIQANPDKKQGYLAPQVFIEHVKDLIAQTKSFGIKFAFVRLTVYRATRVKDVLKVCQIRRPGDICSADDKYVYIFLFGCRESDIAKALTFIFHIPSAQLFESEQRNATVDETLLALEEFERVIEQKGAKDHTEWLAKNSNQTGAGSDQAIFDYRQNVVEFNQEPAVAASIKPLKVKSG